MCVYIYIKRVEYEWSYIVWFDGSLKKQQSKHVCLVGSMDCWWDMAGVLNENLGCDLAGKVWEAVKIWLFQIWLDVELGKNMY